MNNKIEASIFLASYMETVGYRKGAWEFNYQTEIYDLNNMLKMWATIVHHYLINGGPSNLNIKDWYSSDDTIMILYTIQALIDGGGVENYKKQYIDCYDLLLEQKRNSGNITLESILKLKRNQTIVPNISMGGNGAAMRTGPIGIFYHNNIEKVIEESIISSKLTHNHYIGYLGGMITALFTAFALNGVKPWLWVDELLKLYDNKILEKYEKNLEDLQDFIGYWKRYKEVRLSKLKYKNVLDNFIYVGDRLELLMSFNPNPIIRNAMKENKPLKYVKFNWEKLGSSGLDCCIYAYDSLLMSMQTPDSVNLDFNNIVYSYESFLTLVAIHPGDNDTTAAVGGTWYGALNGYTMNSSIKNLEFFNELDENIKKMVKKMGL